MTVIDLKLKKKHCSRKTTMGYHGLQTISFNTPSLSTTLLIEYIIFYKIRKPLFIIELKKVISMTFGNTKFDD
jgi:hypothetical protein